MTGAPESLVGRTVHLLNGTRYAGEWTIDRVWEQGEHPGGYFRIAGTGGQWSTRMDDVFATEADARAEARNRRQPRRARQAQPLYGDFAQLAALHGIATDGTGRRNR